MKIEQYRICKYDIKVKRLVCDEHYTRHLVEVYGDSYNDPQNEKAFLCNYYLKLSFAGVKIR
jgi:hypothetical protein